MENKARKRVKFERSTQEQLRFYMKFCNQHPELQLKGSCPELWRELASNLNALRGPTRTAAKWKENFSQWRSQIRCRARKAGANLKTADKDAPKPNVASNRKNQWIEQDVSQPPAIDVMPCIEEMGLQDSHEIASYQSTIIDSFDVDTDFSTEIKVEALCDDDDDHDFIMHDVSGDKLFLASATQSPPPPVKGTLPSNDMTNGISSHSGTNTSATTINTSTTSTATTTTTPKTPTTPASIASSKRVTPATIYAAMLQSFKKREEAEDRAAELQLQTVSVLQHLSHSLLTISDTLTKLNEKLDKL